MEMKLALVKPLQRWAGKSKACGVCIVKNGDKNNSLMGVKC